MRMRKNLEKQADEANALMRFFEDRGRRVTGLSLDKGAIHLQFSEDLAVTGALPETLADIVRMD